MSRRPAGVLARALEWNRLRTYRESDWIQSGVFHLF